MIPVVGMDAVNAEGCWFAALEDKRRSDITYRGMSLTTYHTLSAS